MKEKLVGLIHLQECDNKINRLEILKKESPVRIKKLEDDLNAEKAVFQADSDKLESMKKERRKIEQLTQDLEGKAEKSKIKLSSVKSNKEYTAALKEIEEFDKERSTMEDSILRFMEDIEAAEKKCVENKKAMENIQKKYEQDKIEIEKKIEELNRESELLGQQRKELLSRIDKELLGNYEFLKAKRGGIAVGSVIGGVCQLCHINLPPQAFNEIKRGNSLMSCPNCYRIVYWGEDEFFQNILQS